MKDRGSILRAFVAALGLVLGCGDSSSPLEVAGQDAGTWAADGALSSDGEAQAGAGGGGDTDANLIGFGRDAGAGDEPDAAAAADAGPLELQDGGPADAGCVENDCGGCGALHCPAAWNGTCVRDEPCGPCPAGCYPLNVVGLTPKFQCDGDTGLVCNACVCE